MSSIAFLFDFGNLPIFQYKLSAKFGTSIVSCLVLQFVIGSMIAMIVKF